MKITGVVLAAGLSTRMKSSLPKVLHTIHGTPMLQYVLDTVSKLNPQRLVLVVGKHSGKIRASIRENSAIVFAEQKDPRGTGHAVLQALPALPGFEGTVLVLNGDAPLVTHQTLKKFLAFHKKKRNDISVLSFIAHNPASYGRVLRDDRGRILSVVEERDATAGQKLIREVSSGVYAIESHALPLLRAIRPDPNKGEYYLTDLVHIGREKGLKENACCIGSEEEFIGVNTREELARARVFMKERMIRRLERKDVHFLDTASVFLSPDAEIGRDTTLYPNVHLEGKTRIGRGCVIYPNVRIRDSVIEDGAVIKDSTLIEDSTVRKLASVGPFAHIRPGTVIGREARIGNFVEVKQSVVGSRTKASHLTYLGDAQVGRDVNIGAGTITCNYDGKKKHPTTIEDYVFIGSDSQLIAPVRIGKRAYVGAGSTITKDVPSGALAVSRTCQTNIKGWARKKQLKVESEKTRVKKRKTKHS
ncbi:MAG: bifunctional UDP-N-acetylglucosamine diphosphorylase/glucosamine-1-phosphate N-acetyltransferase GlmU [Nitrospirota bacterium]